MHMSHLSSSHGRRLTTCAATGVTTAAALSFTKLGWQFMTLGGWAVTAAVFLSWTWLTIGPMDATQTAQRAMKEDETRAETGLILVASSTMSLVGVGFGLLHASSLGGARQGALTALCVAAIALSWSVLHTVFTLRYAHEFFTEAGGIDFGGEPPAYADFAYVAFTVGMTYQVSDTDITSRAIRATVTRQALLSFVFGTVVVAVTINVVAGLVQN